MCRCCAIEQTKWGLKFSRLESKISRKREEWVIWMHRNRRNQISALSLATACSVRSIFPTQKNAIAMSSNAHAYRFYFDSLLFRATNMKKRGSWEFCERQNIKHQYWASKYSPVKLVYNEVFGWCFTINRLYCVSTIQKSNVFWGGRRMQLVLVPC